MNKLYDFIEWHNNTTPAINETNLNAMSQAIDDIDDRVIEIAGTVLETVPELEGMIDEVETLSKNPPYIGQNGNWWVWDTETGAYVDSGVDASITVSVGTTSTLPAGSSATVTNSGTGTDPVLNFGIPQGATGAAGQDGQDGEDGFSPEVTIATITGGHTVTITDEDHPTGQTFNVMDGQDGDVPITVYSQTLSAGSTSVTFSNVTTTASSIIEVGTSKPGLEYNAITNSGTSYTVTFDAQSSSETIYLLVTEVS
jgi:hypothetical protein